MNACLLVLIVNQELEDSIVDLLLARDEIPSFTQQEVRSFSRDHAGFSLVEQVAGRRDRLMFQIRTSESTARELLKGLRRDLPGVHVESWLMPLLNAEPDE
ncbi:MAG: DUF3240 family protein [Pseudomonadota bacterium]|nr:DUF3240 family protein [Pseudomonadota bacterium]